MLCQLSTVGDTFHYPAQLLISDIPIPSLSTTTQDAPLPQRCQYCLESTVGPRFKNSWIFMTKRFESWAKTKMNLILRFPSSIMTEIADSITPTLARVPTSLALKPQIATENISKHSDMVSRVERTQQKHFGGYICSYHLARAPLAIA
jgi:hypothetical protein